MRYQVGRAWSRAVVSVAHARAAVSDRVGATRFGAWLRGTDKRGAAGGALVIGIVLAALVAAFVWQANTGESRTAGEQGAVSVTVTSTVTSAVTEAAPVTNWEEDGLPDEMYRWSDAHPGADMGRVPEGHGAARGHVGCWWVVADTTLVMCPDGYRAES